MIVRAWVPIHGLYRARASQTGSANRNQTMHTRWPGYSCWWIVSTNLIKTLSNWGYLNQLSCSWSSFCQDLEEWFNLMTYIARTGIDMAAKCMLWVWAWPNYEPLFSILDGLRLDRERRYWIVHDVLERNISDIRDDIRQRGTNVEILVRMSHKTLTSAEEDIKW